MTTIYYGDPKYQYKGWIYCPESDVEPDNIKIFHTVITPDKRRISFDWSPYSTPSLTEFQLWIDLGCPARITSCPLNLDDLKRIKAQATKSQKAASRDHQVLRAKLQAELVRKQAIKKHKLTARMVEVLQVLSVATLRQSSLPATSVTLALVRRGLAAQQPNGRVVLLDAGDLVIKDLTAQWWDYMSNATEEDGSPC